MKKLLCLIFIIIAINLSACGGNIKNVNVIDIESEIYSSDDIDIESEIYSSDDIDSAIRIITEDFDKNWKGCTLKEIYYAGDEISSDHQDWADRNDADEVIVLLSSFDVDSSGGDGSLNPNSTYDDWNWILVRSNGGQWKHVDHGY